MKLKTMPKYIISQWDKDITREEFAQRSIHYATFAEESIELKMFTPCNKDGFPIKKPINLNFKTAQGHHSIGKMCFDKAMDEYIKAQEKVWFKDFSVTEEDGIYFIEKGDVILEYNKENDMWIHGGEDVYWNVDGLARYAENVGTEIELHESLLKKLEWEEKK